MSSAPNELQKSWREFLRGCGSIISYRADCEIHHPVGRTGMQDKQPIGHWYLLALTPEEHRELLHGGGQEGLMELKDRYEIWHPSNDVDIWDMSLHEFEKFLFSEAVDRAHAPFPDDIYKAIMAWHR